MSDSMFIINKKTPNALHGHLMLMSKWVQN